MIIKAGCVQSKTSSTTASRQPLQTLRVKFLPNVPESWNHKSFLFSKIALVDTPGLWDICLSKKYKKRPYFLQIWYRFLF